MTEREFYDRLGFYWQGQNLPPEPPGSPRRALFRYRQSLSEFVYDASQLEGNPLTYVEVKNLMDGVSVSGHPLADERQVMNLVSAAKSLFSIVEKQEFRLEKSFSDRLHHLIAFEEAWEWGHFRGEGQEGRMTPHVALHDGKYRPPETQPGGDNLKKLYLEGLNCIKREIKHPCERGMVYFLFTALQQFYFDGNKRTGRFMMNGKLMSHGWDAISIPAHRALEFNELMTDFFTEWNGSRMLEFLYSCRPQDRLEPQPPSSETNRPNPNLGRSGP